MRKGLQLPSPLLQHLPHSRLLFLGWTLLLFISIGLSIVNEDLRLLALAPVALGIYLAIADFRAVYLLMWACIPFSTELEFEGGFGMDFPAEALMILLTGIGIFWGISKLRTQSLHLLLHPISLFIGLHVGWIALTTVTSTDPFLSLKFLLAKIWYIVPFYLLSYALLRSEKDVRVWYKWLLIPLGITVAIILVRHLMLGFRFEDVNEILKPFYRNHVDYALILGVFFPFVFVFRKRWTSKWKGWAICGILLIAIYLTYTRAAYLGLMIAAGGFLLTRLKLTRYAILLSLILGSIVLIRLAKDNRYIDFAPDYYRTITHYEFSNLLEATYKFEDVSTMERFYRWIGAFYMIKDRPITGYGPNNFTSLYKTYTDRHFVTYVSDNPEQSGVHNYFLMTAVEQGIPGLIIFLVLLFVTLLRAEWLYHQLKPGFHRQLLSGVIGSLFFILFALLLNDMIETDKVGSFFFLNLAFIPIIERMARKEGAFKSPT